MKKEYGMNDFLRENLSYFELFMKMFLVKKMVKPEYVSFGEHKLRQINIFFQQVHMNFGMKMKIR